LAAGAVLIVPPPSTTAAEKRDVVVEASDLTCILEWTQVRNFRITNILNKRKLKRALRVAARQRGHYPPGTVIQLIPFEVMVKHRKGFAPETNDWEFMTLRGFTRFQIDLDPLTGDPIIDTRGTAAVVNFLGGNCVACHGKAEAQYDFVCEQDHGCDSLGPLDGFTAAQFDDIARAGDPRCENVP
jgi:hypothetical protein